MNTACAATRRRLLLHNLIYEPGTSSHDDISSCSCIPQTSSNNGYRKRHRIAPAVARCVSSTSKYACHYPSRGCSRHDQAERRNVQQRLHPYRFASQRPRGIHDYLTLLRKELSKVRAAPSAVRSTFLRRACIPPYRLFTRSSRAQGSVK